MRTTPLLLGELAKGEKGDDRVLALVSVDLDFLANLKFASKFPCFLFDITLHLRENRAKQLGFGAQTE